MKTVLKVVAIVLATALVFAAGYLACALNDGITVKIESSSGTVNNGGKVSDNNAVVNVDVTDAGETTEPVTDAEGNTAAAPEAIQGGEDKPSVTAAPSEKKALMTKAEIVEYYNTAANKVKSEKAGFTKHHVQGINGDVNIKQVYGDTVGGLVLSQFEVDDTKTVKKGKSSNDEYPAGGFEWASKLKADDIESATITQNGSNYEILIKLGKESNPTEGDTSAYGRVMTVQEAADVAGVAGKFISLEITNMNYYNGYVKATIDSATGNIVKAELSATVDVSGTGKGTALYANSVTSTETFTDFVW